MIHKLYQNEPSFKLTVGMLEELKNCYGGETTIGCSHMFKEIKSINALNVVVQDLSV